MRQDSTIDRGEVDCPQKDYTVITEVRPKDEHRHFQQVLCF